MFENASFIGALYSFKSSDFWSALEISFVLPKSDWPHGDRVRERERLRLSWGVVDNANPIFFPNRLNCLVCCACVYLSLSNTVGHLSPLLTHHLNLSYSYDGGTLLTIIASHSTLARPTQIRANSLRPKSNKKRALNTYFWKIEVIL